MANFFRSVLLRLQNKSVTAGTSNTSVSADTGYDGLGTVTVSPTPSETKTQAAGTSNIDVTPTSGKLLSKVTVTPTPSETKTQAPGTTAIDVTPSSGKLLSKVTVSAIQTETKTQAAGTSNIDVTPTSGKYLTKVTVTPQQHSGSFTPTANLKGASGNANDMGSSHNNRYVDTSGMIVPSGNKAITSNGTGIDVKNYATASVSVPNPTLSGDADEDNVLANKTFYKNSYTKKTGTMANRGAFEGEVDPSVSTPYELSSGYYSSIDISVLPHTEYSPSSSTYTHLAMGESKNIDLGQYHKYRYVKVDAEAPSGNKSITANGTGIDVASYSTVSVSVPHPTHTTTYTPAANKSNNDMGATHSYRYVNTSGMIVPSGAKSITANGTGIDVSSYATANVNIPITSITPSNSPVSLTANTNYKPSSAGYAIEIYKEITPSNSNPVSLYGNVYTDATARGIYKIASGKSGCAIESYSQIAPSNSSPVALTNGSFYKIKTNDGYAIQSYQSVSPSTSGASFSSGMVKMDSGGYAYSSQFSAIFTPYTLWTNSSPTSSFGNQEVTLSDSIMNYSFIGVQYRTGTGSDYTIGELIIHPGAYTDITSVPRPTWLIASTTSARAYRRQVYVQSNTAIHFNTGYYMDGSAAHNTSNIPIKIIGYKAELTI